MIIAGPCSITNDEDCERAIKTADDLNGHIDYFRCKIFLGGTRPETFKHDYKKAVDCLKEINKKIPSMTEVQCESHVDIANKIKLPAVWIGARNCLNYGLLKYVSEKFKGEIFVKRSPNMTVDETINLYNLMKDIYKRECYIIDRGINTLDRNDICRWRPDILAAINLKYFNENIFKRYVIDISHSTGYVLFAQDIFYAYSIIGCRNFMIESTIDGESETDKLQMIPSNIIKIWSEGIKPDVKIN